MVSDSKKAAFLDALQPENFVRQRRQSSKWLAMFAILSWAALSYCFPHCHARFHPRNNQNLEIRDSEFDWNKITPNETLQCVPCFEGFQCSRLQVPLDYAQPNGSKAAIALLKLPSKYPVGDPRWRGPILYNPGGPGDSGTDFLQSTGQLFLTVIGDDYDHIGFDPRGVGHTTPTFNLFPSAAERSLIKAQTPPPINSTPDALGRWSAYAEIVGDVAIEREKDLATHLSTAVVSRDMLQITKAHGRDKLLYWGFSYGTVLGITYASMFPDNIERIIVDGVVDTVNYYEAAWSDNLLDSDKALDVILEACAASFECALHESTPQAVKTRLSSIFSKLATEPIPYVNGSDYGIVDFSVARLLLLLAVYSPAFAFPSFASAMAEAEKGNGSALFALSNGTGNNSEALTAIACGEGNPVTPTT